MNQMCYCCRKLEKLVISIEKSASLAQIGLSDHICINLIGLERQICAREAEFGTRPLSLSHVISLSKSEAMCERGRSERGCEISETGPEREVRVARSERAVIGGAREAVRSMQERQVMLGR